MSRQQAARFGPHTSDAKGAGELQGEVTKHWLPGGARLGHVIDLDRGGGHHLVLRCLLSCCSSPAAVARCGACVLGQLDQLCHCARLALCGLGLGLASTSGSCEGRVGGCHMHWCGQM